jgi:anti-sigma factor RsiW
MTSRDLTDGMEQDDRRLHDEGLLSGYLDGELTQAEAQFVEVRLEASEELRRELAALQRLRGATMSMKFAEPTEKEWDEHARGIFSRGTRGLGWVMVIIWSVCLLGYAAWQFLTSSEDLLVKLMVFGLCSGLGLLFVSVLADRIRSYGRDKYRRVIR